MTTWLVDFIVGLCRHVAGSMGHVGGMDLDCVAAVHVYIPMTCVCIAYCFPGMLAIVVAVSMALNSPQAH